MAAEECVAENAILRRVIPDCIEDTGGLFVTTPDDDPAYGDQFLAGCRACDLPAEEIDVAEALRQEPRLNPGILRAFAVPDASIDAWKTVWSFARGASAHGARILPYHRVIDLRREDDAVTGARVRNERTGEELDIEAGFTINAAGAWAAQIAHMAQIEGVGVVPGKGIMIAMNDRLVNTVINRCTMLADGDILVPIRTVSVIGTTDSRSADPDEIPVTQDEVDQMLDDGERLVPGFRDARALRVWPAYGRSSRTRRPARWPTPATSAVRTRWSITARATASTACSRCPGASSRRCASWLRTSWTRCAPNSGPPVHAAPTRSAPRTTRVRSCTRSARGCAGGRPRCETSS